MNTKTILVHLPYAVKMAPHQVWTYLRPWSRRHKKSFTTQRGKKMPRWVLCKIWALGCWMGARCGGVPSLLFESSLRLDSRLCIISGLLNNKRGLYMTEISERCTALTSLSQIWFWNAFLKRHFVSVYLEGEIAAGSLSCRHYNIKLLI